MNGAPISVPWAYEQVAGPSPRGVVEEGVDATALGLQGRFAVPGRNAILQNSTATLSDFVIGNLRCTALRRLVQ